MHDKAFRSQLDQRRQLRETLAEGIARKQEELAKAKAKDANAPEVKILETQLAEYVAQLEEVRKQAYKDVRERLTKPSKDGGK